MKGLQTFPFFFIKKINFTFELKTLYIERKNQCCGKKLSLETRSETRSDVKNEIPYTQWIFIQKNIFSFWLRAIFFRSFGPGREKRNAELDLHCVCNQFSICEFISRVMVLMCFNLKIIIAIEMFDDFATEKERGVTSSWRVEPSFENYSKSFDEIVQKVSGNWGRNLKLSSYDHRSLISKLLYQHEVDHMSLKIEAINLIKLKILRCFLSR